MQTRSRRSLDRNTRYAKNSRRNEDADRVLLGRTVIENGLADARLKAIWLGHALARNIPFTAAKLARFGTGPVVRAVREKGPFDAVIFNSVAMAGAAPGLFAIAPMLHVSHNNERLTAAQNAVSAGNPALRWLFDREARLLGALESTLATRSRFVWCLSEDDRLSLQAPALAKSAVLPLTVNADPLPSARAESPGVTHDIGLIGTWTWEPNTVGLRWFCDCVVPLLPDGMSVAVAGRLPAGFAAPARVKLLGRVPDAGAFVGSCRVLALAARAGTGVQLKTIEAFERGMPAVATTLSLRGIAQIPVNVVIADEAQGYAAALASMVASSHRGTVGRVDGQLFARAQIAGLQAALQRGLRTLA